MSVAAPARLPVDWSRRGSLIVLVAAVVGAGVTSPLWLEPLRRIVQRPDAGGHDLDGHGESSVAAAAAAPGELEEIELSPEAQNSIGLRLLTITLGDYDRVATIPATLVEIKGRSRSTVTSPIVGVVERVYRLEGEAVAPGEPLFDVRLTQEDLVQSQADLLKTALELEVIDREIMRLEVATRDGGLAGRAVLERQYERQRQEASLQARRQALLFHGLSEKQIDAIVNSRQLLRSFTLRAPLAPNESGVSASSLAEPTDSKSTPAVGAFQVQELTVDQGQAVAMGASLATLTDYSRLLVEGEAFEQDAEAIERARSQKLPVAVVFEPTDKGPARVIKGLPIRYVSNRIDAASRSLHVYVDLANESVGETEGVSGERFTSWRHRPGQRASLRIPIETWEKRIELPIEAIAVDGPETFVFVMQHGHFLRCPVEVEHRDPLRVVVKPNARVKPGKIVAANAAQQLHLAIKNRTGGAPAHDHDH